MLEQTFTRFGSQFREGAIIHVKFLVASGPVFAAKSTRAGSFHKKLSLTKTATGKCDLVLSGGARELAILNASYVNIQDPTDVTDCLSVNQITAWTESTGTCSLLFCSGDGSEAATDPFAGDEIHITLYVAK